MNEENAKKWFDTYTKAIVVPDEPSKLKRLWWDFKYWFKYEVFYKLPKCIKHPYWKFSKWFYEEVRCRINNRQKWLNKAVGRTWTDKTNLIPTMLYAAIIHFVDKDGEDCFNSVYFEEQDKNKILEIYNWAKTGKAEMEKQLEAAYPDSGSVDEMFRPVEDKEGLLEFVPLTERTGKSFEELYGEVHRIEAEIEKRDTEYLTWIVLRRGILWT